jgi:hypothetical protein
VYRFSFWSPLNSIRSIRPFCLRLWPPGRQRKLALTACMRKLLILLKAIAHRGMPWRGPTGVAVPCAVI